MPEFDSTTRYINPPQLPGYSISSDGFVWTCLLWANYKERRFGNKWRILKSCPSNKSGHTRVTIYGKRYSVHRLILETFVGPCPTGMEACHDPDPDPSNNNINNLRWGTSKDNAIDRDRHGRTCRGEHRPLAKITEDTVRIIRNTYVPRKISYAKLGRRFGLDRTTVCDIVLRKTWKHIA